MNCGKFGVPCSSVEHDYTGVVENSFELRVGDSIRFVLGGFWVIEHLFPFFWLGSDILFGGQKAPNWSYKSMSLKTNPGRGTVSGSVRFKCKARVEEVLLA